MGRLAVHSWVQENRKYLPADFISNDSKRPEAVKQLGQLSEKATDKEGRIDEAARDQEFAKNSAKYNSLNSNPNEPKIPEERPAPNYREGYTKQPTVTTQKPQPNVNRPQYNYNNIQRAQQYHSGSWQQAQPRYQPSAPARGGGFGSGGGRSFGGGGGGRR